jgi:hypothetical protein
VIDSRHQLGMVFMWTLYEPWPWQRVTLEDGSKSKRGEVVMTDGKGFRLLTPEECAKRDRDAFEEQAASF